MKRIINVDMIYYISNYLNTKDQKLYLSTEKEASYSLQFEIYKKKLIATKIQRWWRKHFCAPTLISGCYGYTISYKKLTENWGEVSLPPTPLPVDTLASFQAKSDPSSRMDPFRAEKYKNHVP